jgi:hypothetical protein
MKSCDLDSGLLSSIGFAVIVSTTRSSTRSGAERMSIRWTGRAGPLGDLPQSSAAAFVVGYA